MLCQFNMLEEIRDFTVVDTFIYTVRDRDVCINEIIPGGYFCYIYSYGIIVFPKFLWP
jgi:hypothetical protein